jgi:uncharacterized RDD family membrane protein YckC
MNERIHFETPENVQVSYPVAGLGTRFVAYIIDSILLWIILIIVIIVAIIGGLASDKMLQDLARTMQKGGAGQAAEFPMYVVGLGILIFGLGSFFYYGLSEFFMAGQTIGKRQVSLRVVKVDGFSLDASSIFMRNLFRIVDHIPVLWVVPALSKKSQRLGDMVAGTIIVKEEAAKVSSLRERLLERPAAEALFYFTAVHLGRARPQDFEAVEKLIERWFELNEVMREKLLHSMCEPLAKRLQMEVPDPDKRLRFLEELLAAEYRRQYRQLG